MSTAVTKTNPREAKVASLMEGYREAMTKLLPKHLSADRALELCSMAIRETPLLMECTAASLMASVIECAKLGLSPNNHLGHAYLIPFKNGRTGSYECQIIIGYQGFLELVRRSGSILKVESRAVFAGDAFDYGYGTNPFVQHKPICDEDPAKLSHVYAIAWLAGGVTQFDVMTKSDVERIRRLSKAASKPGSPWQNHYVAMAKKTVIRRLCKNLPCSDDLRRAVDLDERNESELSTPSKTVLDVAPSQSRLDALADALAPEPEPEPEAEEVPDQNGELPAQATPNKAHPQILKAIAAGVINQVDFDYLMEHPTADQPALLDRLLESETRQGG